MSLRRSARAPTTQPATGAQQHTQSSTSSVSSGRVDRNGRSRQGQPSPQDSTAAGSRSSEDGHESAKGAQRKTRSSNDDVKSDTPAEAVDIAGETEEEETRCICGQLEYPGLPVVAGEAPREGVGSAANPGEDNTGWFIQCDSCQVWQHGGCIGILDEAQSPEKYFCELCRKDLHRISHDVNGRKYSRYRAVQHALPSPPSPDVKVKETSKRVRESRMSRSEPDSTAKGRRATMNSRESAYDEVEQLQRAIEASKKENLPAIRKAKRGRSESETRGDDDVKRRRTASGSTSSQSKNPLPDPDSEDEAKEDLKRSARGSTGRPSRNRETHEPEIPKEADRVEVKKKAVPKRKTEDSEHSPDSISRAAVPKPPSSSSVQKATPPAPNIKPHKRWGRPPARRGRLGRNQYSKDRGDPSETMSNHSPHSAGSEDGQQPQSSHHQAPSQNSASNIQRSHHSETNGLSKPSRPRHMNPNRTTMNDMKRRVAGILEYISHTQVELAGLDIAGSRYSTFDLTNPSSSLHLNGSTRNDAAASENIMNRLSSTVDDIGEEIFEKLNAVEMMEVLTRRLMKWQVEYGKYGDK